MLPAFLVEFAFYLVIGFPAARKAFDRLGSRPFRASLLFASALLPYLIAGITTHNFHITALLTLAAVCFAAAFWYAWIRPAPIVDILFLALLAAVYLGKIFDPIYGQPAAHVPLAILGQLMWIRLNIMAVLSLRGIEEMHLSFVPTWRELRIGALFYLVFLPVAAALAYLVHFAAFRAPELIWWKLALLIVGSFLAWLWVVALFEEFFFRGFLLVTMGRWMKNETAGLIASSIVFGLAHLFFRKFPNWRFAVVAAVAGIFYGLAFLRARSVRAGMVTHALVVVTWRVFFNA